MTIYMVIALMTKAILTLTEEQGKALNEAKQILTKRLSE